MVKNKTAVAYRIPLPVTTVIILANGNAYPLCPHCNTSFEREYQQYCDRCGQALSWRHFNSAAISYIYKNNGIE